MTFEDENDKYALDSRYADKRECPTQRLALVAAPDYKGNSGSRVYFHKGVRL